MTSVISLSRITALALVPVATAAMGGAVAAVRPLGAQVRSYIQHFAAGVVFSVVAVELLPDVMRRHLPWEVGLGFGSGVLVMLALRAWAEKKEGQGASGLLFGVAVDVSIDGMLIGIGFAAGEKEGILLTLALGVELFSLGLAVAAELRRLGKSPGKALRSVVGLSFLIVVGALIGSTVLRPVSSEVMELVLSFGLAALLFLVTEELLVKAHREPDTLGATAVFFAGFLIFLIVGMMG